MGVITIVGIILTLVVIIVATIVVIIIVIAIIISIVIVRGRWICTVLVEGGRHSHNRRQFATQE